jgi:hypothetical protein
MKPLKRKPRSSLRRAKPPRALTGSATAFDFIGLAFQWARLFLLRFPGIFAPEIILLNVRHATLAIGGQLGAMRLGSFGLFQDRLHSGYNAFAHVPFDVLPRQSETCADRGIRIFRINRLFQIAGEDNSLKNVKVNNLASRRWAEIRLLGNHLQFILGKIVLQNFASHGLPLGTTTRAVVGNSVRFPDECFVHKPSSFSRGPFDSISRSFSANSRIIISPVENYRISAGCAV